MTTEGSPRRYDVIIDAWRPLTPRSSKYLCKPLQDEKDHLWDIRGAKQYFVFRGIESVI